MPRTIELCRHRKINLGKVFDLTLPLEQVAEGYHRDQGDDEFPEQCKGFISDIEKETPASKFTFAELEENEQNLERLRK